MIPDPLVVEAAARSGADWVGLDLQHGAWDLDRAFRAIQLLAAIAVPSVVRIAQEDMALLPRLCDHGASGVVIAMVESPQVAASAVDAARYQPEGRRSFGGHRYGLGSGAGAQEQPAVFAMIEDRRGFDAVEEIAATPGLAGLHVGPVDLALGLGLGFQRDDSTFRAACARIREAAVGAGIPATMHAVPGHEVPLWMDLGWDEVVLPADMDLLRESYASQVRLGRASVPEEPGVEVHSAYGRVTT